LLLDPLLGDRLPYATVLPAVAVTAWVGGWRPALLATGLSVVLCAYLFVPARYTLQIESVPDLFGLGVFAAMGVVLAVFGEVVLAARKRADARGELLRTTLASIGDAVLTTDTGGRVAFLNAVAEQLTGWAQADAAGRPLAEVFRVVNEQTRKPVENPVDKVLSTGLVVGLANHTVLIARDGSERPIDDSAAPVRDAGGAVVGVVLVFRDVTERRAAAAANERLAATLEGLGDGFWQIDRDWRITFVNGEACRSVGRPREELLGRVLWEAFPAVVGTPAEGHYRRAVRERVVVEFENFYDPVGKWFGIKVFPTADGGLASFTRDVTDRKQFDGRVRAEAARAQLLADAVPALISYVDADGRYRLNNRAYEQWFGHPREAVLGRHMREVLGEAGWAAVGPHVAEALGGRVVSYQTEVVFRDGHARWISATYTPDVGEGGAVRGFVAHVNDITPQKRAEEAVRRSEAEFRALFEGAGVGKAEADVATGRYLRVNQKFCDITGYTAAELLGRTAADITHPDDVGRDRAAVAALLRGESDRFEHEKRYVRKDGSEVWVQVTVTGIGDPPARLLGAASDVTARRRADAAAERRSEQVRRLAAVAARVTLAADVACVMGVVADEARHLIPAGRAVLRFTPARGPAAEVVSPPGAVPAASPLDERVVVANRPLRLAGPDAPDGTGWLAAPLVGRDGRNLGLLQLADRADGEFTADDEAVLVQLAQMAAVSLENARLVDDLKAADRRKDEFLATLAHELRGPLAPIRNAAHILQRHPGPDPADAAAREVIARQVRQMARLIDDLLDVSRITLGRLELKRERVELGGVVAQAVEAARPFADAAGHTLTHTLPADPVVLDADPARLAQVFANLLTNACKYTDRGGRVTLAAAREGDAVVVRVADTGIGIAPDHLSRLFEMFSQAAPAVERSQGGLGIGLALVRGLVEMHGGSIVASSGGPGTGSEFTVRLPVPADAAVTPAPAADPVAPAHPRRILVVDDSQDSAESLALLLQLHGNEVRTAGDGLEAVAAAEQFRPEVVLLDLGMPRLNGYDACRRIREQEWGRGIVVIAQTGWGADADRRRTEEAGFDGHLVKPVDFAALTALLATLNGRR
jgi:PAS domain S-box-containing protein